MRPFCMIGHNVARDAAIQYNIQLIIAPHIEGRLDKKDLESILSDFLSSLLPKEGIEANSRNINDAHEPRGLGVPGFLPTTCFELLATFRKDWSKSIEEYNSSSLPAIETLERTHLESIATWLASSGPAILVINVTHERRGPSWTTDFVLEMVDFFESASVGSGANIYALVAHPCRRENSRNYGEEGVLQGILAQIIESDPGRLENPGKYQHIELTEVRPHAVEYACEDLWDMIVECLRLARIRILVIILDHIEEILLQGRTDDSDRFERFVTELNCRIKNLFTDHGIIVKTMVTCRLVEAATYFSEVGASFINLRNPYRRRSRAFDPK
ncbi:hypothetical protein F4679DRAFT_544479 [Xylaria curta]|nr:hypothetical protein F4679DRAFT_544479 [Xylaria curta]